MTDTLCEFCEIDGYGNHAPRCPVFLEAEIAELRQWKLEAADEIVKHVKENAALREKLAGAEKAIADHNSECASVCGDGEQEGVRCGYRPYFPRHCPECPRDWMIARSKP